VDICNPSTLEAEAAESQVDGQSGRHGNFKVSLCYILRPLSRINKKPKNMTKKKSSGTLEHRSMPRLI
jgi:hypothetical protein